MPPTAEPKAERSIDMYLRQGRANRHGIPARDRKHVEMPLFAMHFGRAIRMGIGSGKVSGQVAVGVTSAFHSSMRIRHVNQVRYHT